MAETAHPGRNGGVYLVSAARTPIGKFGGALADVPAVELGGFAIRAAHGERRRHVPPDAVGAIAEIRRAEVEPPD